MSHSFRQLALALFATAGLTGCPAAGEGANSGAASAPFEGRWRDACHVGSAAKTYEQAVITFKGNEVREQTTVFTDATCQSSSSMVVVADTIATFSFQPGESSGVYDVDLTFSEGPRAGDRLFSLAKVEGDRLVLAKLAKAADERPTLADGGTIYTRDDAATPPDPALASGGPTPDKTVWACIAHAEYLSCPPYPGICRSWPVDIPGSQVADINIARSAAISKCELQLTLARSMATNVSGGSFKLVQACQIKDCLDVSGS
jgi:hypothetical protein